MSCVPGRAEVFTNEPQQFWRIKRRQHSTLTCFVGGAKLGKLAVHVPAQAQHLRLACRQEMQVDSQCVQVLKALLSSQTASTRRLATVCLHSDTATPTFSVG